jgi:hypothetical protein
VMERIGMTRDPAEDFDDPDVAEPSLRRHVVYRIRRAPEDQAPTRTASTHTSSLTVRPTLAV